MPDRWSTCFASICSGDMYVTVPRIVLRRSHAPWLEYGLLLGRKVCTCCFARPKSRTFTRPIVRVITGGLEVAMRDAALVRRADGVGEGWTFSRRRSSIAGRTTSSAVTPSTSSIVMKNRVFFDGVDGDDARTHQRGIVGLSRSKRARRQGRFAVCSPVLLSALPSQLASLARNFAHPASAERAQDAGRAPSVRSCRPWRPPTAERCRLNNWRLGPRDGATHLAAWPHRPHSQAL